MNRIFTILIVLISSINLLAEEPAKKQFKFQSEPVTKENLKITLLTDQDTFTADQHPQFTVRFENTGTDYINLYNVGAYWKWTIYLTKIDSDVIARGPWNVAFNDAEIRQAIIHQQLKVGETFDQQVNLNDPACIFRYQYSGLSCQYIPPLRNLSPGNYKLHLSITFDNPYGPEHKQQWVGPATTETLEFTVNPAPEIIYSEAEKMGHEAAIDALLSQLDKSFGLWRNGSYQPVKLSDKAKLDDILDQVLNNNSELPKHYTILKSKPIKLDPQYENSSATLIKVGNQYKIILLIHEGETLGWWNRTYATDYKPPAPSP